MSPNDFVTLVRSQAHEDLEKAWQDAVQDPGQVQPYCDTLEALCESNSQSTALSLAASMLEALGEKNRVGDALRLATTLMKRGSHNENLARRLFELVEKGFSDQEWFGIALESSKLSMENLDLDAFQAFDRISRFTVGSVLYHRAGWGEGVVENLDCEGREVEVRFASGRVQTLPLESALTSLRPLDSDDLRAMRLTGTEELQRLVKEEPAVLIRKAVKIYRGRATSTQVKSELCPSVVPAKSWASFWKKAKTAAASDPWLQVEGSNTRPVFVLRKKPLSLADEAKRALSHTADLGEALAVIRDYLSRNLDADAHATVLDMAQERVERSLEGDSENPAYILDGILLLEEMDRKSSISAAEELKRVLLTEEGGLRPAALDELATQEARDHAVTLLGEALGEQWHQLCIDNITDFPDTTLEPLVNHLQEKGKAAGLVTAWTKIAPYPRRFPILTYLLGRLYAEDVFKDREDAPDIISIGRVMLHLLRILEKDRKGNTVLNRIRTRLTSLLVGRRALLPRCMETIGRDDLASYLGISERAGDDFPMEVSDTILKAIARKYPELTRKEEKPFWELEDFIYTTATGFDRQKEEYRVLVDEKIPANSKAIGNAASLGDLSENSEWEAAMEEQRNLTTRAQEMDQELRRARLLEDQQIPDGVAAPGTRVSFTYLDDQSTGTFRILGPWDGDGSDILNYRAPAASQFLGKGAGDQGQLEGDGGSRTFRIDTVEKVI